MQHAAAAIPAACVATAVLRLYAIPKMAGAATVHSLTIGLPLLLYSTALLDIAERCSSARITSQQKKHFQVTMPCLLPSASKIGTLTIPSRPELHSRVPPHLLVASVLLPPLLPIQTCLTGTLVAPLAVQMAPALPRTPLDLQPVATDHRCLWLLVLLRLRLQLMLGHTSRRRQLAALLLRHLQQRVRKLSPKNAEEQLCRP
jgi:hypothetical protein